ncbi:MAG: PAS domain-containing protein [Saprospiraceae bacterium]|jgi:PAS domain-containing protein
MRILSFPPYQYFFQLIKEEPAQIKRYSLFLVLIPLLVVCFLSDWNPEILLFISLAYLSATVGLLTACTNNNRPSVSFQKHFYHQLISENLEEMLLLVNNDDRKILFANPAFYEGLGLMPGSAPNIFLEDFIATKEMPRLRKNQFIQTRKKGSFSVHPISSENEVIQVRKQNGDMIWVELSAKAVGEEESYTLYKLTEVTEKVLLKRATSQYAKDLVQRKSLLKALKRKEAEVILMMNIERSKLNI